MGRPSGAGMRRKGVVVMMKIFPFMGWFKGYNGSGFRADVVAGLTVALVLIPQSMAYAQLAGMPAYYGLYAAFLPPLVAALFGSSPQLSTGPVAIVSLMTAASLEQLAVAGSDGFIAYAILLSFIIGAFQFVLGLLRLGIVVNFLSHPVIVGFSNAAALIIASSQLPQLLGVSVDKGEHHYETIVAIFQQALYYTHMPTVVMGGVAFGVMLLLKKYAPRFPSVLVVASVAIVISALIGFDRKEEVALADIASLSARSTAQEYTVKSQHLSSLVAGRDVIQQKLSLLDRQSSAWIRVRHDLDQANHEIRLERRQVKQLRYQLRRLHFSRVVAGARARYYLYDETPGQAATDGALWRLRLGAGSAEPHHFIMAAGGEVLGHVPGGLPSFQVPRFDGAAIGQLLSSAMIIALLGFMEAISIAKTIAAETGSRLDPNQELIGQGLGNMVGAFGQSYPTSGSFSRSAVNLGAGAQTGISSVVASLTVVVVLLFFTPLLYHLPQCVLGAIILLAVLGLINVRGFVHAWRAQWYDGGIAVITFVATLYFAPHLDRGILVGGGLSLLVFLYKSMRPQVVSLSRGEDKYLHGALAHGLKECDYIDMIRFDGPLFFANASYLEDQVILHMESKPDLKHIIIEASGISMMDASGEEALALIVHRIRSAGLAISFSGLHQDVLDVLIRTGMSRDIGIENFYPNMDAALNAVYGHAHKDHVEISGCPLRHVIYADGDSQNLGFTEKWYQWNVRNG